MSTMDDKASRISKLFLPHQPPSGQEAPYRRWVYLEDQNNDTTEYDIDSEDEAFQNTLNKKVTVNLFTVNRILG